jgi:hypothetical protein
MLSLTSVSVKEENRKVTLLVLVIKIYIQYICIPNYVVGWFSSALGIDSEKLTKGKTSVIREDTTYIE